jgi:uncharacterized protein YraI
MRIAFTALAILAAIALPTAAEAASKGTARASGNVPLRAGPGSGFETIGKLANGEKVHLQRCTYESNWCLVLIDGDPAGWARGSYLVGSGAKLEVTPHKFIGFDPLDPLDFRHRDHNDDD